jgi:hypothetical protein
MFGELATQSGAKPCNRRGPSDLSIVQAFEEMSSVFVNVFQHSMVVHVTTSWIHQSGRSAIREG